MSSTAPSAPRRQKKVVVIMGPTGCGKSKLSVDLASRFFPNSEIINSDKIQLYRGLDITSNKTPFSDRKNVPHHLLGDFHPSPELTASDFRSAASVAISQISSRRNTPFLVGGSNSFVYALLAKKFSPEDEDVFRKEFSSSSSSSVCKELRYSCCFIWVDVSPPVLNEYLSKRVNEMVESGMVDELAEYFSSRSASEGGGLEKTIGVPEFERYFERFGGEEVGNEEERERTCEDAVRAMKENTCQLAKRQLGKIVRLRDGVGWDLKRVDATEAMRAAMESGGRRRMAEMWERDVLEPSVNIVKKFLTD